MTAISYDTVYSPPSADLDLLSAGIQQHNRAVMGEYESARVAVFVRDSSGDIVGGVYGDLRWDWLHIRMLWVHQGYRGQGVATRLIRMAEDEALARGITRSQVETISFQAIGFYLKCGYQVFAELRDKPVGHTWYYLKRELAAGGG